LPTELIDLAASRGVRVMALTDHDTLEGLPEATAAAARHPGFTLIPGVELSCDVPGSEVHMLGLFIDPDDAALNTQLARFRERRLARAEQMVAALDGLGVPVEWTRVQEIAGEGSVGRPHVAQALLERGYVETITEAFDRYLGRNSPAYVQREKLTPAEAVTMLRAAGGLPVFAHPSFTEDYEQVAASLAAEGLFGMEVFYKAYGPELVQSLHELARAHSLFPLGGSDYHALDREDEREPGDIPLPDEVVEAFLAAARDEGCRVPEPAPAG
jgi:hypothetical protein